MPRYVVSFHPETNAAKNWRRDLAKPLASFVNAVDFLGSASGGLKPDVTLEFPEIDVLSLHLSPDEAEAVLQRDDVFSVRESRITVGSPATVFDHHHLQREFVLGSILPWHIGQINADKCWATATGRGVKVGVIDSAIDNTLANLPIRDGKSFNPDAADWFGTDDFHGTACASLIGTRSTHPRYVGVAPDCDLYALRVTKGGTGNSEYIAAAMIWAAQQQLDVVSLSQWEFTGASDPHQLPWDDVDRASQQLMQAGCIIIGISGNSGDKPNPWVTNPGRCPAVMAVGATNFDESWWSESSYGPDDLPIEQAVEIVAPGNQVSLVGPGDSSMMGFGTSFAAPQVAGACALIKQAHPGIAPADIRDRIRNSATDLAPPGRDAKTGLGFLNCQRAIA